MPGGQAIAGLAARYMPAAQHWLDAAFEPFRDVIVPIILSVAGVLIQIGILAHAFSPPHNVADAMGVTPLLLLLAAATVAAIILIGISLTPLLDLSLGPIGQFSVKMTAAVLFPAAIGSLMYGICGQGASGIVVGWLAAVVLYLSLFRALFDFDWPDALLLIAFVALAHTIILFAVLWPLTHNGPLPLPELWRMFEPIVIQSALTFLFAGGMLAPHFGEA
jgi:hypothetical protein